MKCPKCGGEMKVRKIKGFLFDDNLYCPNCERERYYIDLVDSVEKFTKNYSNELKGYKKKYTYWSEEQINELDELEEASKKIYGIPKKYSYSEDKGLVHFGGKVTVCGTVINFLRGGDSTTVILDDITCPKCLDKIREWVFANTTLFEIKRRKKEDGDA